MKNKFIIILIWFAIINILINICYYLIIEDGINIIIPELAFKFRYHFRERVSISLDYDNYEKNNVISKENASIKLSNIKYEKESGKLNLKFELYEKNDYILDRIGGVIRIYDDKKIFFHGSFGGSFDDWKNMEYLLFDKDLYGEVNYTDTYNQKLYGKLDDSNLNLDKYIMFNNIGTYETINAELSLDLGKDYEINNNLYIDILDYQYKSVDEFVHNKPMEPLGEFKFIINF